MKWVIAITASLVLNLVLIFWGRGSFIATLLSMFTSIWIGLPLLILSAVFFVIAVRRKSQRVMNIGLWTLAIALGIFSTLLAIPIGRSILESDIDNAQSYCESLVPRLEQSKNQTGIYPKLISEILAGQKPPSFLPSWFYYSDGTNFDFTIIDPGEIMGGVEYMSQTKSWHRWD